MLKPSQPCDLKLGYAGAVFWIEAHSPAGREWLDQAIEGSRPSAASSLYFPNEGLLWLWLI